MAHNIHNSIQDRFAARALAKREERIQADNKAIARAEMKKKEADRDWDKIAALGFDKLQSREDEALAALLEEREAVLDKLIEHLVTTGTKVMYEFVLGVREPFYWNESTKEWIGYHGIVL